MQDYEEPLLTEEAEAAMRAAMPEIERLAAMLFAAARERDEPPVLGECVESDWDAEF